MAQHVVQQDPHQHVVLPHAAEQHLPVQLQLVVHHHVAKQDALALAQPLNLFLKIQEQEAAEEHLQELKKHVADQQAVPLEMEEHKAVERKGVERKRVQAKVVQERVQLRMNMAF